MFWSLLVLWKLSTRESESAASAWQDIKMTNLLCLIETGSTIHLHNNSNNNSNNDSCFCHSFNVIICLLLYLPPIGTGLVVLSDFVSGVTEPCCSFFFFFSLPFSLSHARTHTHIHAHGVFSVMVFWKGFQGHFSTPLFHAFLECSIENHVQKTPLFPSVCIHS